MKVVKYDRVGAKQHQLMENGNESMKRLESSNEIIAYNSKISADYSSYLAWIKMMGW